MQLVEAYLDGKETLVTKESLIAISHQLRNKSSNKEYLKAQLNENINSRKKLFEDMAKRNTIPKQLANELLETDMKMYPIIIDYWNKNL